MWRRSLEILVIGVRSTLPVLSEWSHECEASDAPHERERYVWWLGVPRNLTRLIGSENSDKDGGFYNSFLRPCHLFWVVSLFHVGDACFFGSFFFFFRMGMLDLDAHLQPTCKALTKSRRSNQEMQLLDESNTHWYCRRRRHSSTT